VGWAQVGGRGPTKIDNREDKQREKEGEKGGGKCVKIKKVRADSTIEQDTKKKKPRQEQLKSKGRETRESGVSHPGGKKKKRARILKKDRVSANDGALERGRVRIQSRKKRRDDMREIQGGPSNLLSSREGGKSGTKPDKPTPRGGEPLTLPEGGERG